MKTMIVPLLSLALLAGCAERAGEDETVAAPSETTDPADAAGPAAAVTIANASGTVESVDPAGGRIVIAHGPVEALEWPAMTMGFIATPEQIDAVEAGQEVEFEFRSEGTSNTITSITPAR